MCNSFLLQKDNKGHPRDGEAGGSVYVSVVVKALEYQWRITTRGCTSKLQKPNRRATATTTTTTNGDAHQEIQKKYWERKRERERYGQGAIVSKGNKKGIGGTKKKRKIPHAQ
jgi:hypothetical protein